MGHGLSQAERRRGTAGNAQEGAVLKSDEKNEVEMGQAHPQRRAARVQRELRAVTQARPCWHMLAAPSPGPLRAVSNGTLLPPQAVYAR